MNENSLIWNPFLSGYFENPRGRLRFWREHNPVHRGINNCWMLFKYEDVKFFLTSPIFKTWKTHEAIAGQNRHLDGAENFDGLAAVFSKVLLFLDAPEHPRLRGLVTKIWNSQAQRASIEEAVDESLAALAGKTRIDLVTDFARAVPTRVISKILGLPAADYAKITNWSYQFMIALEPFISLHQLRRYNREAVEFREYLAALLETKRKKPDDRFISRLLTINETLPEPLGRDKIISVLCLLFFAGIETSVNLLSQSILLLIDDPDQAALARSAEMLPAAAANELIRYVSPVNYTKRVAAEDVEIRGKTIRAGDALLGGIISANFDAEFFEDPEKLDLTRERNHHLGFGQGSHFCLGARLGREQISHTLPALFRRYPNIGLRDEENHQWDRLIMNRALKSLPVNMNL